MNGRCLQLHIIMTVVCPRRVQVSRVNVRSIFININNTNNKPDAKHAQHPSSTTLPLEPMKIFRNNVSLGTPKDCISANTAAVSPWSTRVPTCHRRRAERSKVPRLSSLQSSQTLTDNLAYSTIKILYINARKGDPSRRARSGKY